MSEDRPSETPTLDCVICYNEIDVADRAGYMLAPCDHIFHRQCLEQWMEIKVSMNVFFRQWLQSFSLKGVSSNYSLSRVHLFLIYAI
jgi:hypothetical protein